jgi:release factor glutamine methyltransferase
VAEIDADMSADACLRVARASVEGGEAALLLAHVLGRSRGWLYAHGDAVVPASDAVRFADLVARRAAGEPVAYLMGTRGFWGFDLSVDPDTLIPRPETELLVELALARIAPQRPMRVADLGTGSGAIALAIASERPHAALVASDASAGALEVAARNVRALGVRNIEFRHGDWFAPLAGERFDLVASNPPYIGEDDPHLARGDLRFEPRTALVSGADGLDAIRAIVAGAPAHLRDRGWLLVEHGWQQGAAVRALFEAAGFVDVDTRCDLEQRDRVTLGRR